MRVSRSSQELDTVEEVFVNVTGPGATICNGSEGATTRVTFLVQYGSLSNVTANTATLSSSTAVPTIAVVSKGRVR